MNFGNLRNTCFLLRKTSGENLSTLLGYFGYSPHCDSKSLITKIFWTLGNKFEKVLKTKQNSDK